MFAAFLAAMVLIAVAFTGCGKDSDNKGGGGANSVEWDPAKTVHPDQEGAAVLLVTGDTGTFILSYRFRFVKNFLKLFLSD